MTFEGGTLCYSSDTGSCEEVIELARGADFLIHEATGESDGHSSAEEAGEIAQKAGVRTLYLIHYPPRSDKQALIQRAKTTFSGEVIAAEDLMSFSF